MMALPPPPRAALMLIGDELLSGKIQDENGAFLARFLRERGVQLCEVSVLGDDPQAIADALIRLSQTAQWIISSGGVGPTHDDCTMQGMALGLGRQLCEHPELAKRLRQHYGQNCGPEVLGMAQLPTGAKLYGSLEWPVTGIPYGVKDGALCNGETHRLYVLPGVPSLFAKKIEALAKSNGDFPEGPRWETQTLEVRGDESSFSATLREIAAAYPEVDIGSYPKWERDLAGELTIRVSLTFESRTPGAASLACQEMKRRYKQ